MERYSVRTALSVVYEKKLSLLIVETKEYPPILEYGGFVALAPFHKWE